jgi:hypothetical protein
MSQTTKKPLSLLVGRQVLVMIDFQRDMYLPDAQGGIPRMGGVEQRVPRARWLMRRASTHQHNYHCRVVEDYVGGSSLQAHDGALRAMEYLRTGARCSGAAVLQAFAAVKHARVA